MLLALVILLFVGGFLMISGSQKLLFEVGESNDLSLLLMTNHRQQRIRSWYDETDDRYYFFLPAYCKTRDIRFNEIEEDKDVALNGAPIRPGSKFKWQEKTVYLLEIQAENAVADYDIIFVQSENLPAVFVRTESGYMSYIYLDKENEEKGSIDIITADGNMEYSGKLSKISGRGNSTWGRLKKPYSIKLQEKKPLLGMDAGDKWNLLAGWNEGARMNEKVAFDIAELLGLDYSPQCTWVDLYLNGEYTGIYLLAESVSVGEGRLDINDLEKQNKAYNPNIEEADTFKENGMKGYIINNGGNISGGYLFERDLPDYWEPENAGFIDSDGNTFTIKSPQHASREQVEYLSRYVQNIGDMLNEGNIEYRNYVDFESFARKFIIDEISLNYDVNITSMFYYKKPNDDLLYAGPVWDFDLAFGEVDGDWVNYEHSLLYPSRAGMSTLNWYAKLYDDEVFRDRIIKIYSTALPRMENLIETEIDIYADYIRKSVELDKIRWEHLRIDGSTPGHYTEFDNNVKYLKFFLAKRLNYLNKSWDVDYSDLALPHSKGTHEVSFWIDGEIIETKKVADGEVLEGLPPLDENIFSGWHFTHNDEKYCAHIPIYENTAFYAKRKAGN